MADWTAVIPSKGRAGRVTTHKLFNNSIIACPEAEVAEYSRFHDQVRGIPDTVKGITPSRNNILDWNMGKHVQVDDDAKHFYIHEEGRIKKIYNKTRIEWLISQMFEMTEDWGYRAFGLSLASDQKFYREYSPFSTLSVIGANIIGVIDSELRFDERLVVKEDYDFSLQQIHKFRGVLRFNKYGISVTHLTNKGGVVAYRTKQVEIDAYETLLKKWGPGVIKASGNKNFVRVNVPLDGI